MTSAQAEIQYFLKLMYFYMLNQQLMFQLLFTVCFYSKRAVISGRQRPKPQLFKTKPPTPGSEATSEQQHNLHHRLQHRHFPILSRTALLRD